MRLLFLILALAAGLAAQPHGVTLTWSYGEDVVDNFYIYRGGISGGPYSKLAEVRYWNRAYEDTAVVAGATYYYVLTAFDSLRGESAYSNEAKATIPADDPGNSGHGKTPPGQDKKPGK